MSMFRPQIKEMICSTKQNRCTYQNYMQEHKKKKNSETHQNCMQVQNKILADNCA